MDITRQQIIGALNMAAQVRKSLPVYFPGTNSRKIYKDWILHAKHLRQNETHNDISENRIGL